MIAEEIIPTVLERVAGCAHEHDEAIVATLRAEFPDVRFSVCREDDIPERIPFVASNDSCRLYFVGAGGSGHCLNLTNDSAAAGGIVVALCEEDAE